MTFRTLGDALTDQYVTVTVVIKYNNMWWKDTTVTKGRNILWRFSILSSQGTLCDDHYMTTGMTLLFCHKTLFMTNFVLTMTMCLCHTNQFFCSDNCTTELVAFYVKCCQATSTFKALHNPWSRLIFGLWWVSLAEYLLVLKVLFPLLQMVQFIMTIARTASVLPWMKSEPWPSICY